MVLCTLLGQTLRSLPPTPLSPWGHSSAQLSLGRRVQHTQRPPASGWAEQEVTSAFSWSSPCICFWRRIETRAWVFLKLFTLTGSWAAIQSLNSWHSSRRCC